MNLRWFLIGMAMIAFSTLLFVDTTKAQQVSKLNLMPWPSKIQIGTGSLKIDSTFSVGLTGYTEPRLDRAVERFLIRLHRQTALALATKADDPGKATLVIHTDHASAPVQELR